MCVSVSYFLLILCLFVIGEKRKTFLSPVITSPNSTDITVDVGEDVKFICRGSESLNWTNQKRSV